MRGDAGCILPLNSGGSQYFGLAFHSILTLRVSYYAPPDTEVSNLLLVAVEQLPSIESAEETMIRFPFLRGTL